MGIQGHVDGRAAPTTGRGTRPYVRPGALLLRVFNPIAIALGRKPVLSVRGRRSGKAIKVPMDPPFAWQGSRYLVSPRGDTYWSRNLRAAGEAELRIAGVVERLRVQEVTGEERDAVVRAYASTITCNCRRSMALLPDPADHPVFRILPPG